MKKRLLSLGLMPCSLVDIYTNILVNSWLISSRLLSVGSLKTALFTVTTMRSSDIISMKDIYVFVLYLRSLPSCLSFPTILRKSSLLFINDFESEYISILPNLHVQLSKCCIAVYSGQIFFHKCCSTCPTSFKNRK
jgi:hypothetical protein